MLNWKVESPFVYEDGDSLIYVSRCKDTGIVRRMHHKYKKGKYSYTITYSPKSDKGGPKGKVNHKSYKDLLPKNKLL